MEAATAVVAAEVFTEEEVVVAASTVADSEAVVSTAEAAIAVEASEVEVATAVADSAADLVVTAGATVGPTVEALVAVIPTQGSGAIQELLGLDSVVANVTRVHLTVALTDAPVPR